VEWLGDLSTIGTDIQRFFNDPFLRAFGDTLSLTGADARWRPLADIERLDDRYVVCMELPGMKKEDVRVEVTDSNQLLIQGERKPPEDTNKFTRMERNWGEFRRQFTVPRDSDLSKLKATMHDGLLEITIPRNPEVTKGKEVKIE